jgi:hypothetical protein
MVDDMQRVVTDVNEHSIEHEDERLVSVRQQQQQQQQE